MLGSSSLFYFGIGFSILLALFLGGCGLSLFLAENDEAPDERDGDIFLAQELRRHAAGPSPDHTEIGVHHSAGVTK